MERKEAQERRRAIQIVESTSKEAEEEGEMEWMVMFAVETPHSRKIDISTPLLECAPGQSF
jgi:hypothetical protein